MKRLLLLIFLFAFAAGLTTATAQADRLSHPVSTAKIVGVDGKAELMFDEVVTQSFTVNVLDLTGKLLFSLKHDNSEPCISVDLPVENLRKGIYMVQVSSADGKMKTLKLQRN